MKYYLSESAYLEELAEIQEYNESEKRKQLLKAERKKIKHFHLPETSKIFTIYLFVLLNAIIIYAMVAMWVKNDLSYLGVLITDIAAQVLVFGIYCVKAYKGKKEEESLKFQRETIAIQSKVQQFEDASRV